MSTEHDSRSGSLDASFKNDLRYDARERDGANPFDVEPFDAEEIARVDEMLTAGFRELDRSVEPAPSDRVDAIVDELRGLPDISTSRRTRRSIRTLLWISAAFLSLLATYALASLALRAMEN
jgi:hypothetical protein